jgi:hypothetical protein
MAGAACALLMVSGPSAIVTLLQGGSLHVGPNRVYEKFTLLWTIRQGGRAAQRLRDVHSTTYHLAALIESAQDRLLPVP